MASRMLRVVLRPCFAQCLRSPVASVHVAGPPRFGTVLRRGLPWLVTATGIAGAALGTSSPSTLHCDDVPPQTSPSFPPPPKSSVKAYELTFGTVCGLCAGVFVKKSARMLAFFLGGLFVILQYLGSASLVKVDWARMGARFENLFYTTDAVGHTKSPSVWSMWKWIVDFLTADFQPRASFVVGLALGLRVG